MKKLASVAFAGAVLFAACTNDNSSSIGTYEEPETTTKTEKKEEHKTEEHMNANTEAAHTDTAKATMSMHKDSTGVKVKVGEQH